MSRGTVDTSTLILRGQFQETDPLPDEPPPFDAAAARSFGQVATGLRRAGRKPAAHAYDAMIAAIALANDLPLHTSNPRAFTRTEGLTPSPSPTQTTNRPPNRPACGGTDLVHSAELSYVHVRGV